MRKFLRMGWLAAQLALIASALALTTGTASAGSLAAGRQAIAGWDVPPVPARMSDVTREAWEGTNPSITQKILAYDRWVATHGGPPGTLILGTSRSVMLDPQDIRRTSGSTAFNAGISNGATREFNTMTSYADLRSPGKLPHIVLLLDVESFDNRAPTRRVRDYQQRILQLRAACPAPRPCASIWLDAASRIAADARARQNVARPYTETQTADGRQINDVLMKWEREGVDMQALRDRRIKQRIASYGPGGFTRLSPVPIANFRAFLKLANARGIDPVIVLTGMHPDCIRRCGPAGWNARRTEVRRLLASTGSAYRFRFIDFSFPSTWRGSAADFLDEIHLRPAGAHKVVVRLDELGAFDPGAAAS